MAFISISLVSSYFQWMIALVIAVVSFRCVYIIMHMSNSLEENINLPAILAKVQNHVKALIILVIAEGLIEYIKGYLF